MARPLVQAYLDELIGIKLDTIELWSVEKAVDTIVSRSSMEIRNLSIKMLIEKLLKTLMAGVKTVPLVFWTMMITWRVLQKLASGT